MVPASQLQDSALGLIVQEGTLFAPPCAQQRAH